LKLPFQISILFSFCSIFWLHELMIRFHFLLLFVSFSSSLFCQEKTQFVLDSTSTFLWNSETSNWVNTWYYLNTYDHYGNQSDWIQNKFDPIALEWKYFSKQRSYWSKKAFTQADTTTVTGTTNLSIDRPVAEETKNDNFLIYPNPIIDNATIKLPDAVEIKQIDIINVYGKTVRIIDNVNSNIISMQRENLPNGIYFIRIRAKKTYLKKVIIM